MDWGKSTASRDPRQDEEEEEEPLTSISPCYCKPAARPAHLLKCKASPKRPLVWWEFDGLTSGAGSLGMLA